MTHSPSSAQSAEIEKFLKDVATQTPEKPDYWSSCGQCERNSERAQDLLEARADASAHTLGEDAANVAIGEREAFNDWLKQDICRLHMSPLDAQFAAWQARATLTAEKVAGQEPYGYAPVHPNGNYFTRNKSTADYVGGLMPVYAAPQQPAQPVAQTLALTDEQRKSIWWAVLEAEKDEPEPGTLMHRRAQDLRALLAAQPASGGES